MKKIIAIVISCLCLLTARAQSADERVGALLNAADWFELEREYPSLRDSIQTPFLRVMADALAALYLNRDDEAVSAIDTLVARHQAEIGFDNTMNMVLLKAAVENRRGNSAKATDILDKFIRQVKALAPQIDLSLAEAYRDHYHAFRTFRPASLSRPADDVTVDFILQRQDRRDNDTSYIGYSLLLPVQIKGKNCHALLDTGCPTTLCRADFAKKIGLRLASDSVVVTGTAKTTAAVGVMDSINVGGMVLYNACTTVIDNDDWLADSCGQYDLIIGLDFLKQCGEIQFYPHERKIVFPAKLTPLPSTGHNLLLTADDNLRLEAYIGNERCHFLFDTGNAVTALSKQYYERHKATIDETARIVRREGGGIGRTGMFTTLRVPAVTVRTGGSDVRLDYVAVMLDDIAPVQIDDGNMGVNLIQNCHRATLNLKDMFLKLEN